MANLCVYAHIYIYYIYIYIHPPFFCQVNSPVFLVWNPNLAAKLWIKLTSVPGWITCFRGQNLVKPQFSLKNMMKSIMFLRKHGSNHHVPWKTWLKPPFSSAKSHICCGCNHPRHGKTRDANGLHHAFPLQLEEGIPCFHQLPRVGRVNPVASPGWIIIQHIKHDLTIYYRYMITWQ